MSLYGAMYSGISGLSAQSRSLGIISENIANVNTVGYKGSRTQFSTLVTGSSGGVQASAGSLVRQQGLLQSTSSVTDIGISGDGFLPVNSLVADGQAAGEYLYTRAGSFTLDADRNLVNSSGYYLTGWGLNSGGEYVDANGGRITPDPTSIRDLQPVNLGGLSSIAQATSAVSLEANLPPSAKVGDVFKTTIPIYDGLGTSHRATIDWLRVDGMSMSGTLDPAVSPVVTNANLTDSAGAVHPATFTYSAAGNNAWSLTVSTPDGTVAGGVVPLAFDADGNLSSASTAELVIDWDGTAKDSTVAIELSDLRQQAGQGSQVTPTLHPNGAVWKASIATGNPDDQILAGAATYVTFNRDGSLRSPENHSFTVDWSDSRSLAADSTIVVKLGTANGADGLTSFGDDYTIAGIAQNGLPAGSFSGVRIEDDGVVTALFDNGSSRPVYKIPVARFPSPEGLATRTGNAYQQTLQAGSMLLGESGRAGAGDLVSRALEGSNVDLAGEFTNMITTQRAYSANATIIKTADEMLEELSRLKR